MKCSKFTDRRIMEALKRVDSGIAVLKICRELNITTASFYIWRTNYGSMNIDDGSDEDLKLRTHA